MQTPTGSTLRDARTEDLDQLMSLWDSLFDDQPSGGADDWRDHARRWFAGAVIDRDGAHLAVVEEGGRLVASGVGTLELGVPNPMSPRGRLVRLENVFTAPEHRGRGHGSAIVDAVVVWARSIDADRVDLSATPDGQRLYSRLGFAPTTAPRMKLVLGTGGSS